MRSKKSSLVNRLAPLAVIGSLLASSSAWAALEEVVVTAQKREENVQDVPIAITAMTGAMMEARGLTEVSQVSDFAPNVYSDPTTPFSGSNNVLAAYIRGIGQSDFAFNLEPGVGVYVDGVYLARTIGANVDLLDVERIEVLKGPQGTLFGRNTIGGAINVVTRDPGNEFRYRGEVTTGSRERLDVRGAVEGPIIEDTLYGLVAFSSKSQDGYQKTIPFPGISGNNDDRSDQFLSADTATDSRWGGSNSQNIRAKLVWDVNPDLTMKLIGAYNTTDEQAPANTILAYQDNADSLTHLYDLCVNLPAGSIPPLCDAPRGNLGFPHVGDPGVQQPALSAAPRTSYGNLWRNGDINGTPFIPDDIDETYATGWNFNKMELYDLIGHVDYDMANGWHVKYIGGYRNLHHKGGVDVDGSPLVILEVSFDTKQEQWSHELQLSGQSFDDRLNWVLGLYYFHEEGDLTDYVPFPGGLIQIYGQNFFDTDAFAAFTHLNYALTDRFGLTLGVRYTDEDKKFEGKQADLNNIGPKSGAPAAIFPDPNNLSRFYPLGVNSKGFDDITFRAGIEYSFTDDAMAYASFAQGFKSGGWTTRLSNPIQTTLPCAQVTDGSTCAPKGLAFDEETADTYEIGLKSQLLDRTLQLNMAAFYTEYDNIQVTLQEGLSPVFANAGNGEIWGAEAEFQWVATDALTFSGSLGWIDAEYSDIARCEDDPGTPVDETFCVLKADALARFADRQDAELSPSDMWVNVPEWNASLAGDYLHPLASGATINFHADWVFNSKIANDINNTPELMQDDTHFLNLAVTYTNPSDNWSITAGGKNVTDERHIVTGQNQPAAGLIYGTYNRPAEWYLTLRIRN
ncbi:MAG: TonB-dependent receptor [Gammaproteobacteria bacterium]